MWVAHVSSRLKAPQSEHLGALKHSCPRLGHVDTTIRRMRGNNTNWIEAGSVYTVFTMSCLCAHCGNLAAAGPTSRYGRTTLQVRLDRIMFRDGLIPLWLKVYSVDCTLGQLQANPGWAGISTQGGPLGRCAC